MFGDVYRTSVFHLCATKERTTLTADYVEIVAGFVQVKFSESQMSAYSCDAGWMSDLAFARTVACGFVHASSLVGDTNAINF